MSFVSSLSYEILNYFLNFLLSVFKPELVNILPHRIEGQSKIQLAVRNGKAIQERND